MLLFMRTFSKILAALAAGIALYDICYHWFIKNKFHIRPFKDLWTDIHKASYTDMLPHLKSVFANWEKIAAWPGPVVILIPAVVIYLLFRIIFAIRGGRGGDGFNYKSPD